MKTLLFLTFFSVSSYGATLDCNGSKFISSPYPGGGTKAHFILHLDEDMRSGRFVTSTSISRNTTNFSLESFEHDSSQSRFQFVGYSESNKKITGTITYLSSEGVKASVKEGRSTTNYNCSIFRVSDAAL